MQPHRQQTRAPGSFSPLNTAPPPPTRPPPPRRVESSESEDGSSAATPTNPSSMGPPPVPPKNQSPSLPPINVNKSRPSGREQSPVTPIYTQFTNSSQTSLQHGGGGGGERNFSRPGGQGTPGRSGHGHVSSPLTKGHHRKHSATQGLFDVTLPSTSTSNLSQVSAPQGSLTASQIAAQAAIMSHQSRDQQQQQQQQQQQREQTQAQGHLQTGQVAGGHHGYQAHTRQRSQTVPAPGEGIDGQRRGSASTRQAQQQQQQGHISPPTMTLTEASMPRESAFSTHHSGASSSRLPNEGERRPSGGGPGQHSLAATAAANVVFPRSGHTSPRDASVSPQPFPLMPPPPIPSLPEKQSRSEKAKAKLFSRPGKISTKGESKEKPLPSPGKIGSALSALQRGNFSTSSLVDPASSGASMYNMNNSSAATIRAVDSSAASTTTTETGQKEKKHHFLSRQKHKLKDEFHLPLSSAASNSLPTDPNAPSSLYSFNIPSSPAPTSSGFGAAITKGGKERKKHGLHKEESQSRIGGGGGGEAAAGEGGAGGGLSGSVGDWPGPSSLPSLSQASSSHLHMFDSVDVARLGLQDHMTLDDAWPYLKAKLLVIFEGEDLRLPIEDFNRVVQMHIQYCVHRRSPYSMLEDLRDLLTAGFSSLDRTLRNTPEDRLIPVLVELWMFTFTSILPYIQAVFLPLDLEVSGCGTIMTPDQAREFWGGVVVAATSPSVGRGGRGSSFSSQRARVVAPAATVLDVRRLVLVAYRDVVILPRYDLLKTIFSRLSLEFLPGHHTLGSPPHHLGDHPLSSSPSESFASMPRPGTAMSLDPSLASYNSTSSTLLGEAGTSSSHASGSRSRAISNVSFTSSHASDGRPPTSHSNSNSNIHHHHHHQQQQREQNVQDSKQVTDMVGRMLQCMSVLASLGGEGGGGGGDGGGEGGNEDEGQGKVGELCRMLKLNWLGRGRTGGNRRGMVGGRVRREVVA